MDKYLKFKSEEQSISVLYDIDSEGNKVQKYQNTDVIGLLFADPVFDDFGNVIVEPVQLDGWHVNIRLMEDESPTPLELFSIEPEHPRRVWA